MFFTSDELLEYLVFEKSLFIRVVDGIMTDKEIWRNLKNGKHDALEHIYSLYFAELYNYGSRLTKDVNTVEDSIQEMFVELWNKREGLSDTDNIKPYLYVALKRRIFQSVKRIRKITDVALEEKHFEVELSIDEILMVKESDDIQKSKLEAAFMELSSRQKEILYLKYYSEMDYDEISELMDLNYQSARNLVSRALSKLSKYMLIFIGIVFGIKVQIT